jgi:hypothetical protein
MKGTIGDNRMPTVETNTMKLSKKTHDILKNFAGINPNICITAGSKIVTLSPTKNIMAEAEIPEEFEHDVRIFDLNRFLSTVSLFANPEIELAKDHLTIAGGNGAKIKYWYSDPAIVQPVTKKLSMPDIVGTIDITAQRLAELLKASAVMQLPNLKIKSRGKGTAEAILFDKSDPSTNDYTVEMPCDGDDAFSVSFKVETLKLIPGDYTVDISKNIVSRFTHKTEPLKYFIAMDYKTEDQE